MSRRTCRYFAQDGFCYYGDSCQFLHDAGDGASAKTSGSSPLASRGGGHAHAAGEIPSASDSNMAAAYGGGDGGDAFEGDMASAMAGMQVSADSQDAATSGYETYSMSGPSTVGMEATSMGTIGDPRYAIASGDEPEEEVQPALPMMEGGTTYFVSMPEKEVIVGGNIPTTVFVGEAPFVPAQSAMANEGARSYFISTKISDELVRRQALSFSQPMAGEEPVVEVEQYKNLYRLEPLDSTNAKQFSTRFFRYPTNCYKAMSSSDGLPYCLRHVMGYRLSGTASMGLIEKWKKLVHPNICTLREVFTTKAFGESALVFTHDYFPGAETMQARYFSGAGVGAAGDSAGKLNLSAAVPGSGGAAAAKPSHGAGAAGSSNGSGAGSQGGLKESLIWNFVVQLSSAVRAVHNCGLACRVIHPSKVLMAGESRLRLSGVGIVDLLTFDIGHTDQTALMAQYQQEDLTALGRLILCLACNSALASQNPHAALDALAKSYSGDLKNVVMYLSNSQINRSINNVMPMIGARFFSHIDSLMCQTDLMEMELVKELQNGRLFRLLCKFGIINERPEFNMDAQWSETGDRYLLKLFRDYLFHQVSEDGTPWFDMSHIVHCLNQLDAGSPTKVCMESRNEQSVIIVSYHDLKRVFEATFQEVSSGLSIIPGGEMAEGDQATAYDASVPYS